jgi:hypothetical protein
MKTIKRVTTALCVLALLGGLSLARGAEETKTISGEAKCAKCLLKEGKTHQAVIQAKEGDKTVNYYLVDNPAAKDAKCCEKPKQVTATGTVKEVNGKQEFTATKVEVKG